MPRNRLFNRNELLHRRIDLRRNQTPQEAKLWGVIKNKALGCKFRRQHSVGSYILDFYCHEKKLAIEIDGSQHLENKKYDNERDLFLKDLGITTIRFWNNEIDQSIEGVTMKIQDIL